MFKFERTLKQGKKPDMTPLIDIIFQLILFFMLTTTFVKVDAIDIFVGSGKERQASTVPVSTLDIELKSTDIYLGGKVYDKERLKVELDKEFIADRNRAVKLTTNKNVSIQRLVDIIDLIKASGGSNIMLNSSNVASATNLEAPPVPIPMPELQSTKGENAGSFDFDNPTGWMKD